MEEHVKLLVGLDLVERMTTCAFVLSISLEVTAKVCAYAIPANDQHTLTSECDIQCPLGYNPSTDCSSCTPTHICIIDNPCMNRGTCVLGISNTEYSCNCADGFKGSTCSGECACALQRWASVHLPLSLPPLFPSLLNRYRAVLIRDTTN